MDILKVSLILLISYLFGSIPTGWIIVKLSNGKDVRDVGSGRTGGTNVMRAAGFLAGAFTGISDALKGLATYWIVLLLMPGSVWIRVAASIMAVIGHNYSVFLVGRTLEGKLKFNGGAGGATVFGGAMALWFPVGVIIFPLAALVYIFIGYASVTTMSIAFIALVVFMIRSINGLSPWAYVIYGLLTEIIVLWALRPNIQRLLQGTERAVGLRAYAAKKRQNNLLKTTDGI
jgi:acyl phosphate:glycerol-3-phosphate acyltransferase